MPRKKVYSHKGPYSGTSERIRALVAYRECYLKEKGKLPIWTAACNRMGIHPRTVIRHAPELAAKWYNTDFTGETEIDKLARKVADGLRKARELAAYREDYIRRKGFTPSFKHTCYKIGISLATVKRQAPELAAKWYDPQFHL